MNTAHEDSGGQARIAFIWATVALGVAAGLFLAWKASIALLLIFGGVLLAAAFDALARLISYAAPIGRRWRVLLAVVIVATVLGVALFFGARALFTQFSELTAVIDEQMSMLRDQFVDLGIMSTDSEQGLQGLLPSAGSIFGGATQAVLTFFGGAGNFVLLVFLGIFFALEPHLYKRGAVSLFPPHHRENASLVLHEAGQTLRQWLIGQSISMSIIFLVSLAMLFAIGMPFAALLALQAGLLAFIPLLGPVIAGVPIILAGVSVSPAMAIWGLGVYLLIQALESNIIQPIVQQRTVALPPALTLSLQLVMGVLFGMLGVALAVPLGASLRTILDLAYVQGVLGGRWQGDMESDA